MFVYPSYLIGMLRWPISVDVTWAVVRNLARQNTHDECFIFGCYQVIFPFFLNSLSHIILPKTKLNQNYNMRDPSLFASEISFPFDQWRFHRCRSLRSWRFVWRENERRGCESAREPAAHHIFLCLRAGQLKTSSYAEYSCGCRRY